MILRCLVYYNIAYAIYFLLLFSAQNVFSQELKKEPRTSSLDLSYNWAHTGQNISANWSIGIKKNYLIAMGLKYHLNIIATDNQNHAYKNRFYSRSFNERFGLNLGYSYFIKLSFNEIQPYFFSILQSSYFGTRNEFLYGVDSRIVKWVSYREPFFVFENEMGIGLRLRIFNRVFINQSIGIGVMTFIRNNFPLDPKNYSQVYDDWELASIKRFGLSYDF